MKKVIPLLFRLIVLLTFGLYGSCSGADGLSQYVGCTPGDAAIAGRLGIPAGTVIDFIKWELALDHTQHSFRLNITYGESQPNTLGFKNGGQQKSYQGEFRSRKEKGVERFGLTSRDFTAEIALLQLNPNILHLLTAQNELMSGNGGWSYSLNAKTPDTKNFPLPYLEKAKVILNDTATEVIFEGRTPCQDFAAENQLTVSASCFKLKWKLTLYRNPITHQPTTYNLKRTNSRETDITGNWSLKQGTGSNPTALLLQLDPDKPSQTISLLVGSGNVLFFLHKNEELFAGNENFSFTLNRRLTGTIPE